MTAPTNPYRGRERRWRGAGRLDGPTPSRALLVALLLACACLITLDQQTDGPVEAGREVVGEAVGPLQSGAAGLVRPFTAVPEWLRTQSSLREDVAALEAENSRLRQEAATSGLDRNRLAELDGLTRAAQDGGFTLVPARVVAMGPMQSFSRTVTIDAGERAGVTPDMTVIDNDGLVGRVLRTTRTTATVLLVMDPESVVGGRVGESMEIGFLRGRGAIEDGGRLTLDLVDGSVVPAEGDTVVTWGSDGGAPYVAGVPIGRVQQVWSSPRETAKFAEIEPFVDFSSLDLVGVAVPSGTRSDRGVLEADGSIR
ncbi:rod shape-determining protein MreC [Nocardioides lentus]|uniref:Cell shape-determining protein MreC n=1 Tax=Nocardioides lentus TaxID=338077 RepID=A0ABN2PJZ8_9ACTN